MRAHQRKCPNGASCWFYHRGQPGGLANRVVNERRAGGRGRGSGRGRGRGGGRGGRGGNREKKWSATKTEINAIRAAAVKAEREATAKPHEGAVGLERKIAAAYHAGRDSRAPEHEYEGVPGAPPARHVSWGRPPATPRGARYDQGAGRFTRDQGLGKGPGGRRGPEPEPPPIPKIGGHEEFPFDEIEWGEDWKGLPKGHPIPIYRSRGAPGGAPTGIYTVQTAVCAVRRLKGMTYRLAGPGAGACCEPDRSEFTEYEPLPHGRRFATVAHGRRLPAHGMHGHDTNEGRDPEGWRAQQRGACINQHQRRASH